MTIIINIKPEVQEELSRQAAAHGVDVNSLRRQPASKRRPMSLRGSKKTQSGSTGEKRLKEIAQFSQKIPVLPRMKLSRARVCIGIMTDAGR